MSSLYKTPRKVAVDLKRQEIIERIQSMKMLSELALGSVNSILNIAGFRELLTEDEEIDLGLTREKLIRWIEEIEQMKL